MNPSGHVSPPLVARQGAPSLIEMLVLAFLLAAVAVGAVMSAKLLQKRVLASNAVTATLQIQQLSINPTLTRSV